MVLLIYTFPFLFSIKIGTWVQKINKRKLLIYLPLIRFLFLLFFILTGSKYEWVVFLFMMLDSLVQVFSTVADRIIPPLLVKNEQLIKTNSFLSGIEISMMFLANLAVPFVILLGVSLQILFLVAAVLLLFVFICIIFVKFEDATEKEEQKEKVPFLTFISFSYWKHHFQQLWKAYDVATVNVLFLSFFLLWSIHAPTKELFAVTFMIDEMKMGAESYGFFKSAFRLGNLLSVPFIPLLFRKFSMKWIIMYPFSIYFLYFIFFGIKLPFILLFFITFLVGFSTNASYTSIVSYIQLNVDKTKHGEIFGLFSFSTKFVHFPMILLMSTLFHFHGFYMTTYIFFFFTVIACCYSFIFLFKKNHSK